MAAYEVLLLNTSIPQIQAAQSGDTYVVPRDIAINATAIISANSATDALRITQTGAGNALLVEDSANPDSTPFVVTAAGDVGIGTSSPAEKLQVVGKILSTGDARIGVKKAGSDSVGSGPFFSLQNADASREWFNQLGASNTLDWWYYNGSSYTKYVTLDSSGNLGLGVTPSAWDSPYKAFQISSQTSLASYPGNYTWLNTNVAVISGGNKYIATGYATQYEQAAGHHAWYTAPSGTAGNAISFTQAMTLDASGNLLVGATTNTSGLKLLASDGTVSTGFFTYGGGSIAYTGTWTNHAFGFTTNGAECARITTGGDFRVKGAGTAGSTDAFQISGSAPADAARLTSGGDLLVGTTTNSVYGGSVFSKNGSNANALAILNTATSLPYGQQIEFTAAAPNDSTRYFVQCRDTGGERATIRSNGGLANYQSNNVDLSDIRTKTDINPLASYWNKIAALEIVTYKYKDQTHDDLNIGVIAQQVEQVAPEFVDPDGFGETPEDGVPLKTIYNKDLTFAAIKALQEAMARIEQLEAKVAAMGA